MALPHFPGNKKTIDTEPLYTHLFEIAFFKNTVESIFDILPIETNNIIDYNLSETELLLTAYLNAKNIIDIIRNCKMSKLIRLQIPDKLGNIIFTIELSVNFNNFNIKGSVKECELLEIKIKFDIIKFLNI